MINRAFDSEAGDENDRWTLLQSSFKLEQQLDVLEEYDGMNNETANFLVIVISLPMLVRGHAISTKILEDIISIRVPNLYKLTLGLPCSVLENTTSSFFDCKIRKLIV
jgi:hypothetical protein